MLPFGPGEDPKDRLVEVLRLVCEHVMTRSSDHLMNTNTHILMFGVKNKEAALKPLAVEVLTGVQCSSDCIKITIIHIHE